MNPHLVIILLVMVVVLIATVVIDRKFLPRDPEQRAQLWRRHVAFWLKMPAGAFALAIVSAVLMKFFAHRG